MSIHPLSWVLRHSEATGGCRLVLIVLADHAHDDGSNAWPSVATIAREARMSQRAVQYALRRLEDSGEIVKTGVHRSGTTVYALTLQAHLGAQILHPAGSAPGADHDALGVQGVAPEPSIEPSDTPSSPTKRRVTYAGRGVPDRDLDLAEQLLDRFNALTGQAYEAYGKSGKATAGLMRIVGAVRDLDGLTVEIGDRMIRAALTDPFWAPALPQPGNVFGPGVRDRNFQTAQRTTSGTVSGAASFVDRADARREQRRAA